VRYGADGEDFLAQPPGSEDFEIVYVGAMSGWWSLLGQGPPHGRLERLYDAWTRLGRYEVTRLDARTSSPVMAGRAILEVIDEHPQWRGRLRLNVYGNPYPETLVANALASAGVESVVNVFGPVPHREVAGIVARSDLLFVTLPKRVDGSAGGRISAKTYEYLATDRPILAAVPRGENWDYLEGKPGVWLVEPDDVAAMSEAIAELAAAKLAGTPRTFDRAELRDELSYGTRAGEFAQVVRAAIADEAVGGAHGR
jgi:glycosyltransferase involved in cell wall biosynthesis